MITLWFPSLSMLQHVREVNDLFGMGSSHLKECRVTRIGLGVPIELYGVGINDRVGMDVLGCTLHVLC